MLAATAHPAVSHLHPFANMQMIDMENLLSLLGTPGKVTDAPNAPDLQLADGSVEFRDVQFGYERGVPVLKGVSRQGVRWGGGAQALVVVTVVTVGGGGGVADMGCGCAGGGGL
jgi:ABC-type transport system involved in Fe-S cluster assembly fused permease/ATPase subunit